jgi:hypothetical protein
VIFEKTAESCLISTTGVNRTVDQQKESPFSMAGLPAACLKSTT